VVTRSLACRIGLPRDDLRKNGCPGFSLPEALSGSILQLPIASWTSSISNKSSVRLLNSGVLMDFLQRIAKLNRENFSKVLSFLVFTVSERHPYPSKASVSKMP
jgi:hypothetical protein